MDAAPDKDEGDPEDTATRIDTQVEMDYYEHGGILHYVLRNLAQAA